MKFFKVSRALTSFPGHVFTSTQLQNLKKTDKKLHNLKSLTQAQCQSKLIKDTNSRTDSFPFS